MKVLFTYEALQRLKSIYAYYSQKGNKKFAIKIREGIISKTKNLKQFPLLGQEEPALADLNLGHRYLVEGNFKIIYRVIGNEVWITDLFDTRQDPSKILS